MHSTLPTAVSVSIRAKVNYVVDWFSANSGGTSYWAARCRGLCLSLFQSAALRVGVLRVFPAVVLILLFGVSTLVAEEENKKNDKELVSLESHFVNTAKSGKYVRNIIIEVRDIFDEPDLGFLYRGVNSLKISTREKVVRRELLLEEGDAYDHFLVIESERNLRSLPFLRRVSITPVTEGDAVDLYVQVQDTWTLFPFLSLSSGGGTSRTAIGITDGNILGYGKRLELLTADEDGNERVEGVWDDPRVFGSHQRLTVGHFQRSDGFRSVGAYGEPFRSLSQESSWGVDADVFDLVGRLYEAGDERYVYRQRKTSFSGGYTFSKGDPEVRRRRTSFGYRYNKDTFSVADEQDFDDVGVTYSEQLADPEMLAEDRRFSGPFLSYQQIRQDFLSINYVDKFDRIQDFNLGNEFNITAQFAAKAFDSAEDELIFAISDSQGWRVTPTSFLRAALSSGFRLNDSGIDNATLRLEAKYDNIITPVFISGVYLGKHTIASSFILDTGEDLDRDREFLLGANNGLRAYEDRTFSGDHRMIFNLEDRVLFVEDVLRLVSIGGAVFFDAGGTSRKGVADLISNEMYADVGLGLRFGLTRSGGGNVIRVDLAFGLRDGPDGSKQFEPRLLITSGQMFSADLSTETSAEAATKVSSGF